MTDFVIVIATAAALAIPAPAPAAGLAATIPLNAPTVGFHVYKDVASCERAASSLTAPTGKRLVCLPAVSYDQELASAY